MEEPLPPRGPVGRAFDLWWEENQRTAVIIGAVVGGMLLLGTFGAIAKCVRAAPTPVAVLPPPAPLPGTESPASPLDAPTPAAMPSRHLTELERAIAVAGDQTVRYVVRESERIDSWVPRLALRITVPPGMSRDELETNVRHAMLRGYEKSREKLGAVTVFAYIDEGGKVDLDGPYTAAMGEFAPFGVWAKADASVPVRDWKASVTIADRYSAPTAEREPVGAERVLRGTGNGAVELSTTAKRGPGDRTVATVPGGTHVRILGSEQFEVGFSRPVVRYEVQTLGGVAHRGWVDEYAVHAE